MNQKESVYNHFSVMKLIRIIRCIDSLLNKFKYLSACIHKL